MCILYLILFLFEICLCSGEKWGRKLTTKRLLRELQEIKSQKITIDIPFNTSDEEIGVRLFPIHSKLLEWHFSFTGMEGTPFEGGIYHGRILLHPEYPRKAPSISVMTPNGRWEVNKEICLSATAYHQETWDPNWTLRTLVMALRGHIITQPKEIGGILTTPDRQRSLATSSKNWACPVCGVRHSLLVHQTEDNLTSLKSFSHLYVKNHIGEVEKSFIKSVRKNGTKKKKQKNIHLPKLFAFIASILIVMIQIWLLDWRKHAAHVSTSIHF